MTADLFEPDEYGGMEEEPFTLDGRALLGYEDSIMAALIRERAPEEAERGVMHWYGKDDAVDQKVRSVHRRGKEWPPLGGGGVSGAGNADAYGVGHSGGLPGRTDVRRLGRGVEQRDIDAGDGCELYVHLWQDKDWSIMTEQDRFDPHFSEKLPEMCYSTLPSDGTLVLLKRGESGYFQTDWNLDKPEQNRRLADHLNQKRGVSKAQDEAMSFGSMFGWDKPGADPKVYMRQQEGGMTLG